MNSPGAGGVGPESFFSPGQAERGQAGAGRAAAAGVTAGACPGCAGGAGSQGEAGRGSCAGGACQGCDPLQVEDPWTNWTGNRNTVQSCEPRSSEFSEPRNGLCSRSWSSCAAFFR